MKVMKNLFFIFLPVLIFPAWGVSENSAVSVSGSDILSLVIQPRPLAMAEAFTAVCDDLNSLYFNPAGLAGLSQM
ncbi:MAG: hypothetical protein PHF84_01695 [bacterium]|nr:hypothetical protein [bacterium]